MNRLLIPLLALAGPALAADAPSFHLPVPPVPAAVAQPAQVSVERIEFRGNTVIGTAELQAVAAPHTGRVNTVDELEALRQRLTRLYVERGYVNSGLLLPRRVSGGVLQMEVVEGRLSGLRLRGMEALDDRYVSARLQRREDRVLDMNLLRERFLLLQSDPLIERLNARLVPGQAQGEALMEIDVHRSRPWGLSFFANNYRPASIGSVAAGVAGHWKNLSGRGDIVEMSLQAPLKHGGQGGHGRLDWQLPLVTWGLPDTTVSLGLEHGSSSVIEEPVEQLDIRSRLDSRELGISHTLQETLGRKINLGATWLSRENRTRLLGEPFSFTPGAPDGEVREALGRFWLGGAWRSERQVLALRGTYSRGHNNLTDIPALPPVPMPAKRFELWTAQAHYTQQVLENGAQAVVKLTWQHSADRLIALDGLALGGLGTVRGWRQNQLVRDRGAFLNVEFEYPLRREANDGYGLTLTPFYDRGRASNIGESATTLSSWGLVSRAQWQGMTLDLVLAHGVGGRRLGSTLQDQGVLIQLAYKL
ncbi:ShlB/FhaC/HecB family hemolysin secretion/activation protein [Roseateles microcysteis]|uniref:ShlB/FhaC/HecB family hemolysin secretion/activation protein n=1 Tax=Roseateles microcysteis TaxID=3119057 RepID=UPI002FE620C0